MSIMDASVSKAQRRPYRPLREDPRYDEIKRMIEDLPAEKMEELRIYIQRWLHHS